jgi:two-component system cell cycle response regulator
MSMLRGGAFEDLKQSGRLPSPGGVALKLLDLANREDVTSAELARVLQGDPSLAGRVLKVANAAATGSRPVVSIGDAVVRIGFRSVRQLAMGFSLIERSQSGDCEGFDYARYWSRSLATAVAAERIGRDARSIPADECFTLGLLHDVGSLALATLYPREYAALLTDAGARDEQRRRELERGAFYACSRELTALMLRDWRMPPPLVEAVVLRGARDQERNARTQRLADLLHLAVLIADCCVDSSAVGPAPAAVLSQGLATLGIDPEQLNLILGDVLNDWRAWGQELNVSTRPITVAELLSLQGEAELLHALDARSDVPAPNRPDPEAGLRVLVAEDVASQRLTVTRLLQALGFVVDDVADGLQALAALGERRYDVVVTDLMMPGLDGIGLCRAIRSSPAGAMTYVILLTGNGDHQKLVEAFDAGADDYIQKPIVPRELQARLRPARRVVGMQRQLAREAEQVREANARLEALNRQLASVALTDALTGLPNRRHLLERMRQDWALALRQQRNFCVVFVDLDHFKLVNDERGHEAGDIVLERTARVLRRTVRTEDTVGRFGGEEFVIMCPGCPVDDAMIVAERIRVNLAAEEFSLGGHVWRVTASFGVSSALATAALDWSDVVRSADEALYRAKHLGRNRVESQDVRARPEGAPLSRAG